MSDDGPQTEPVTKRGIYLMGDTPLLAHALAVEGGTGDKTLLAEAIVEHPDGDEVDELINDLINSRVDDG